MKILSIDVGIKNLAFCLFEKPENGNNNDFTITKWDTVNISEQETHNCIAVDKNGLCNKPSKFTNSDNQCFCLKHAKKSIYKVPTPDLKSSFINKQKIQKLFEIADKYSIKYAPKIKKVDLVTSINEYIKQNYLQEIEVKKAADVNLYNIGINIKTHFDKLFSDEVCIDSVIIENQISPIATRMKTIQGMLVQYFVMCPVNVKNVEFISASNKLKCCDIKDKTKYSDRKKLGIAKCLETITTDYRFSDKLDYFNAHKKKDDLADSFLQGLWFLSTLSTLSTFKKS
jgi:hypothetical protein